MLPDFIESGNIFKTLAYENCYTLRPCFFHLLLYNVYGQLLFNSSQSNTSIELTDYILLGFYTVNIEFENNHITRKLVVK